jgi:hypothetical protein
MHIASDYSEYSQLVKQIVASGSLTGFRQNPIYRKILEHVSKHEGDEYAKLISDYVKDPDQAPMEILSNICVLLSSFGNPELYDFAIKSSTSSVVSNIRASPTALRYLYHSILIAQHIRKCYPDGKPVDIVEVGGGYGGLCMAILHNAYMLGIVVRSYTIIDLKEVTELQKMVHDRLSFLGVRYLDANHFGAEFANDASSRNGNTYIVSNYCYSEISQSLQAEYRRVLFPSISHGFMVWNSSVQPNSENLPFQFTTETERPLTGEHNKFVYF